MHPLRFVLKPEAVIRIHDAVSCLAKFSEIVSVEAREDKLVLTALNSSKSAYASFTFNKNSFFEEYEFDSLHVGNPRTREDPEPRFTFQLYNTALLSIFKGRLGDARDKDKAIERCECYVQELPDQTECRLVVKMVCRHGVTKTYKLSYESAEVMHALFNRNSAKNMWTISAAALRSFVDYFGVKTEQLDIFTENGRATFTSYTEKITNGKDVLKQPLQTSITIDNLDFEEFKVEEKLHIGISVKDFRAIVAHAESLKTTVTAHYSVPTRPMQLTYQDHGMQCDFTLMTIGDYRGGSVTPAPAITQEPSAAAPRESSSSRQPPSVTSPTNVTPATSMPPPTEPASRSFGREPPPSQRVSRPSPPPPKRSMNDDTLFLPADEDDDRQWGERNYDDDEDTVGWSASAHINTRSFATSREGGEPAPRLEPYTAWPDDVQTRLAPTQKLSEIENLFEGD